MEQYIYSVLIQKAGSADEAKDEKSFFDKFHLSVRDFFERETNEKNKSKNETIQRGLQRLSGALSPYLSTPLKSDKEDIDRSIKDTIEEVLEQIGPGNGNEALSVKSYRVLDSSQVQLHRQLVGVIKRLMKNGKALLANSGIVTGKNYGTVYLSNFSVAEFSSVTDLQNVIEKTRNENFGDSFTVVNDLVCKTILRLDADQSSDLHNIIIHFDVSERIIEKLKERFTILHDQFGIKNIHLGMHAFYSGFGSKYNLQFDANLTKHALGSIILALVGDESELEDALTAQGSLIVLEQVV